MGPEERDETPLEAVWEIDDGWDVFAADGEKIGDVSDVQPDHIVVAKGFFFPSERRIPVEAIANVERERVYLNVTRSDIDARSWEDVPSADDGEALDESLPSVQVPAPRRREHVALTDQSVDAPLSLDELRITRHPTPAGGGGYAFGDLSIEVPVFGEVAVAVKRVALREEVTISKTTRKRRQRVSGAVLRERATIERDDRADQTAQPNAVL